MPRNGNENNELIRNPEVQNPPSFEFRDRADAESYREWKQSVPREIRAIVEGAMKGSEPADIFSLLPLTNEFLQTLARGIRDPETPSFSKGGGDPRIANLLQPLAHIKTREGFVNAFKALVDPELSWNFRQQLYDFQIRPGLEWIVDQDLKNIAQQESSPSAPEQGEEQGEKGLGQAAPEEDIPPSSEEVRSSMEGGAEKREGEPKPHFRVAPFFGGYYKQLVFDRFDAQSLKWGKAENVLSDPSLLETDVVGKRVLGGKVRAGAPLSLPVPYDWMCEPESLSCDAQGGQAQLLQNQDGLWYLDVSGDGVVTYTVTIARQRYRAEGLSSEAQTLAIEGVLPAQLQKHIEEITKSALQPLARARLLTRKIRDNLTYSNDPKAYKEYTKDPKKFFERIWNKKKADCYVANTLAAAALTQAGFISRFVSGYFVKEKGASDEAILHAGNGHSWLEVYDTVGRRWVRLDATPKGDPNLDEQTQERDLSGEGDFGEDESELMSAQELEKTIKELKEQEAQGQGGGERSRSTREQDRFAELAECTPAQAQEFMRALERVREIKDEHGIPIVEKLIDEWKKIMQEYLVQSSDYRGPVRMDEGDRLEDPVSAKIDIASGEYNPTGFEKGVSVEKIEAEFGGINIYFSFDLSGSMAQPDGASGRSKADVQRDIGLMFVDSLMQCAFLSRKMESQGASLPIKLMATVASNTGRVQLPLTDRWTPKEQWAFYSALSQLASGGTPIHETLDRIEEAFDKEVADLKKKQVPLEKQPIHYIAEVTDGVPNNMPAVVDGHRRLKEKGMALRAYIVGEQPPSEYGTDASDPIETFSHVPLILAKDIVTVFKKLKPARIR